MGVSISEAGHRYGQRTAHPGQRSQASDANGWIYWYNKRWHDYAGTTLEDMQGWGWQKVLHPEHVDRVVQRIRQSFETGIPWEDTFPLRGKDGNYRWFLSRALPIRNEAGDVIRWFGTHTDVTEQIEAENALRAWIWLFSSNERRWHGQADRHRALPHRAASPRTSGHWRA